MNYPTRKCDMGTNQNRGKGFILVCSNDKCKHELPLTDLILCSKCNSGILIWSPKKQEILTMRKKVLVKCRNFICELHGTEYRERCDFNEAQQPPKEEEQYAK